MAEVASDALAGHFPLSLPDFSIGVTLGNSKARGRTSCLPRPLTVRATHPERSIPPGTGSFGRVKFATHKAVGSHWAIKMLKKSEVCDRSLSAANMHALPKRHLA